VSKVPEVNELLNTLYDSGVGEVNIDDCRGELGRITIPGFKTYIGIIGVDKSGDVRRIHVFKDVGGKTIERLVEFGEDNLNNAIIEHGLNTIHGHEIRFAAETLPTEHPAVKLIGNVAVTKVGRWRYRIALRKDGFSPWKAVMMVDFDHESSTWYMSEDERHALDTVIDSIRQGPDGYIVHTSFMRDYILIDDPTVYCVIEYISNVTADMVKIIHNSRKYIIDIFVEQGI
jgi:hypothetical protein